MNEEIPIRAEFVGSDESEIKITSCKVVNHEVFEHVEWCDLEGNLTGESNRSIGMSGASGPAGKPGES